jgi:hypothetical protein
MPLIIPTQESVILVPRQIFSILLQKLTVLTTFMIFYNIRDMLVLHVSDIVSYDNKEWKNYFPEPP